MVKKETDDQKMELKYLYHEIDPLMLDILEQMLQFNPYFRPTTKELLLHPLFDKIRTEKEVIASNKVVIDVDENEFQQKYEWGNIFALPVPCSQPDQNEKELLLSALLIEGILDYLHQSSTSSPSPNQPGDGSCVCTSLPLFVADPRVRKLIDEACAPLDLHLTPVLHNS